MKLIKESIYVLAIFKADFYKHGVLKGLKNWRAFNKYSMITVVN